MPKRTSDEALSELDEDFEGSQGSASDFAHAEVISSVVRMILSKNSKYLKVRKDHISALIPNNPHKKSVSFWANIIDVKLREIFAMTLLSTGTGMDVKSCLTDKSKDTLQKLIRKNPSLLSIAKDVTEDFYFLPLRCRDQNSGSSLQLVEQGVTFLVLSIIVVNDNHVEETNLLRTLEDFGLSENKAIANSNLNKTSNEILQELVKKEYIQALKIQPESIQLSKTFYVLGPRAAREYLANSFKGFLSEIFPTEDKAFKIEETLKNCFPN